MFKCKGCPPNQPVKLQRVQYGHFEDGKFVVDSQSEIACCYCHTVHSEVTTPPAGEVSRKKA